MDDGVVAIVLAIVVFALVVFVTIAHYKQSKIDAEAYKNGFKIHLKFSSPDGREGSKTVVVGPPAKQVLSVKQHESENAVSVEVLIDAEDFDMFKV